MTAKHPPGHVSSSTSRDHLLCTGEARPCCNHGADGNQELQRQASKPAATSERAKHGTDQLPRQTQQDVLGTAPEGTDRLRLSLHMQPTVSRGHRHAASVVTYSCPYRTIFAWLSNYVCFKKKPISIGTRPLTPTT